MDYDELPNDGHRREDELHEEKRNNHRHQHRHSSRRRWFISPLWFAIAIEALVIVGLLIWGFLLERDINEFSERERSLVQSSNDSQYKLAKLGSYLDQKQTEDQESCSPKPVLLKLDEFIEINKGYVKRAFFMQTGKTDKKTLEYKILLKNDTATNLMPKFDVIFSSLEGKEVGRAKFGYKGDGTPNEKILEKGEVRTIDGTFDVTNIPLPDSLKIKTLDD